MRQPKHNTLSTPYNPKPFVVEVKKGTMVTASNGSHTVTRNSSHFKLILNQFAQSQENDVKKDDDKTPKIQQKPSDTKEESRDDPNDLPYLTFDFLTEYKSSMVNKLNQGTFLIHLFILKNLTSTRSIIKRCCFLECLS